MFFAAMLHSQFVPHIVWQFLCSHDWTVVNHYTHKTGVQNWLGLAAFVQKS